MLVAAGELQDGGDVGRRRVDGDDRRRQLAQRHERAGAVAVVPLVAHLQHLGEDPLDVDRVVARVDRSPHRLRQDRPEHVAHPAQALLHLVVEGAHPQHLAEALVEVAVGLAAGDRVLDAPHPHRRRRHAGHRADRAVVVARVERDLAGGQDPLGVLDVGRPALEQAGADQRAAHRAGGVLPEQRRAGVQQHPVADVEHLAGRPDVDQHRSRGEQPLDRRPVGGGAARVQRQRGEVGRLAEARRPPVDVVHLGALGAQRVGEDVDARGDDRRGRGEDPAQRHGWVHPG